jgi:polyphenol oxidase
VSRFCSHGISNHSGKSTGSVFSPERPISDDAGIVESRKEELTAITFPTLSACPDVRHAVFTRHGGTSRGTFSTLNVGLGVGDDISYVKQNRELISQYMMEGELVFVNQVHGDGILVFSENSHHTSWGRGNRPLVGDAMVTDIPGKNLVIQVADCQPVLLHDPVRKVVANVHSGWKGSIQNIIGKTINVMCKIFFSDPQDIIACIGPSLGPCCGEFINYREEIPRHFWKYMDDNRHFNFWAVSADQLRDAGVCSHRVAVSGICTVCCSDRFFSFRTEKTTGRFAAVIGLKTKSESTR